MLRKAILLIPNFCIVEVFNALAKKHFAERSLDQGAYARSLERFREDIHWGRNLYAYDLNRYHVIAADEIIPIEHNVAPERDRDHLSTFDILVIAMACELAFIHHAEPVYLVTCDRRIKRVCDELKRLDKTTRQTLKGHGGFKSLEERWVPPTVLYLPGVKVDEIPRVQGQKPLNL